MAFRLLRQLRRILRTPYPGPWKLYIDGHYQEGRPFGIPPWFTVLLPDDGAVHRCEVEDPRDGRRTRWTVQPGASGPHGSCVPDDWSPRIEVEREDHEREKAPPAG
jgi:hypothetical protein